MESQPFGNDPSKQYYGTQPPGGYSAGQPYPTTGGPGPYPQQYPGGATYPAYPTGPGQQPPPYTGYVPPPAAPPYGTAPPYGPIPPSQPLPPPGPQPNMYGGEDYPGSGMVFDDQTIRRGFIRKVYSILMLQLALTTGFIALFTFHEPTKRYLARNMAVFWIAFAVTFVLIICMACCDSVRRKSPGNYIFLGVFTAAESVLLGCAGATYDKEEILMAVGITAAVCLALTLFAFQTKWDFTVCGAGLFVALIILLIFGFVVMLIPNTKIVRLVYGAVGALLFSLYLVYDTQLMMGGKHKYSISPEEYIFAALNLYLDVIHIFMYILQIIGASRD